MFLRHRMMKTAMIEEKRALNVVWFRDHDLRLTDHAPLLEASRASTWMLPLYCLDERLFKPQKLPYLTDLPEFTSSGPWRCRFLLQAVHKLQKQLCMQGSNLLVLRGNPEVQLPALVAHLLPKLLSTEGTTIDPTPWHLTIHYHQKASPEPDEDDQVAASIQAAVIQLSISGSLTWEMKGHWGHTLYHPDDVVAVRQTHHGDTLPPHQHGTVQSTRADVRPARFAAIPDTMTRFIKMLHCQGNKTSVRPPLPCPSILPSFPVAALEGYAAGSTNLPSVCAAFDAAGCGPHLDALSDLVGIDYRSLPSMHAAPGEAGMDQHDSRSAFQLAAGEEAAQARLQAYVWGSTGKSLGEGSTQCTPPLRSYKATRAQAGGVNSSTQLSAFLAMGCISPRVVWHEVQKARECALWDGADTMTAAAEDWLQMHLEIRDFYIFTALKNAAQLFREEGFAANPNASPKWSRDLGLFRRWATGTTGLPFVDACMRELAGSGWMSNRGRQNVASFLTKDMGLDWRMGAALFQSLLLDHDTAVNYSNWNYFAGTGSDPRDRRFKTISQGIKYNPNASLMRAWVPELAHLDLPLHLMHAPSAELAPQVIRHLVDEGLPQDHSDEQRLKEKDLLASLAGCYPKPVVELAEQLGASKRKLG